MHPGSAFVPPFGLVTGSDVPRRGPKAQLSSCLSPVLVSVDRWPNYYLDRHQLMHTIYAVIDTPAVCPSLSTVSRLGSSLQDLYSPAGRRSEEDPIPTYTTHRSAAQHSTRQVRLRSATLQVQVDFENDSIQLQSGHDHMRARGLPLHPAHAPKINHLCSRPY